MKKFALIMTMIMAGTIALSGCGKKEADMKYLSDFSASKYVTLGEYKGIEVNVDAVTVSEDEVNGYIDYILETYATAQEVEGRTTVQQGDVVDLDYEGKIDGVAFDGGTAKGASLTIGSGQFIEGFEAGMVGMEKGQTKELNLKFPENYGNEELSGKDVVFTVTVNSINEMVTPKLDEEFVKGLGMDFNTVEDFKKSIEENILAERESQNKDAIASQLEETIKGNCTFKKAPSGFTDRIYNTLINSLQDTANQYGMDIGTVASYYYAVDASDYENGIRAYIEENLVPLYIMMGAIAEKEGITVTDAQVDEEIQSMIDSYGADYTVESYKEMLGDVESYKEYILTNKVLDFLEENAIINEN